MTTNAPPASNSGSQWGWLEAVDYSEARGVRSVREATVWVKKGPAKDSLPASEHPPVPTEAHSVLHNESLWLTWVGHGAAWGFLQWAGQGRCCYEGSVFGEGRAAPAWTLGSLEF